MDGKITTRWWCPVCGIPRTSNRIRCPGCDTASATSCPVWPYLSHRRPDGAVHYRSLRGVAYGFGLAGVRIGREVIAWSAGSFAIHRPDSDPQPLCGSLTDQQTTG